MSADPNMCRVYAVRCAEMAAETTEPRLKAELEKLAVNWINMAVTLEHSYSLTDWTIDSVAAEKPR